MKVRNVSKVWSWRQAIFESQLSATTKLVLAALGSHLNDMGDAMFPSQQRLAKLCSLSERAVITHLAIAEQAGWLRTRKRQLEGKKWAANEYVAAFPKGVKDVHPLEGEGVKDVHVRGEGRSPEGVKDVHTNSPLELSIELSSKKTENETEKEKDYRLWKRSLVIMEEYRREGMRLTLAEAKDKAVEEDNRQSAIDKQAKAQICAELMKLEGGNR
ncbi:helix-turn-helix domain-containing protein [bacterium]|nr:helix-turn-helix domain-containing protein [bacterium]NDG02963.1 helix-turn-helix domain-containing protein [Synechococcaceae bacterium WBB_34_004]